MTTIYITSHSHSPKYFGRRRNAATPLQIVDTFLQDTKREDEFSNQIKHSEDEMLLNVGGTIFRVFKSNFAYLPSTRLAKLARAKSRKECFMLCDGFTQLSNNKNNEYFFHRSPQIFNSVLDIYREGTLHSPLDVCTTQLRQELEYWGIDEAWFFPCCALRFHQNLKNNKSGTKHFLELNHDNENGIADEEFGSSRLEEVRKCLWNILEYPETSSAARVRT